MIGKIIGLVLVVLLIVGNLWVVTAHDKEIQTEKTVEVTVVGNPTNSPYSKYSYTECTFDYGGKRYMTDMRPCVAVVGEHLLVNITEKGSVITSTARYT